MGKLIVELTDEMSDKIAEIAEEEMALTQSEIVRRMLKLGIETWEKENKVKK